MGQNERPSLNLMLALICHGSAERSQCRRWSLRSPRCALNVLFLRVRRPCILLLLSRFWLWTLFDWRRCERRRELPEPFAGAKRIGVRAADHERKIGFELRNFRCGEIVFEA